MGVTFTRTRISNPRRGRLATEIDMLVDTGAVFSVVPRSVLRKIAVRAEERDEFTLADGTIVRYPVGEVRFELEGRRGTSKVILGPEGVTPLLGALTLESLGLMVNPVTREIRPMRLVLARAPSPRRSRRR